MKMHARVLSPMGLCLLPMWIPRMSPSSTRVVFPLAQVNVAHGWFMVCSLSDMVLTVVRTTGEQRVFGVPAREGVVTSTWSILLAAVVLQLCLLTQLVFQLWIHPPGLHLGIRCRREAYMFMLHLC